MKSSRRNSMRAPCHSLTALTATTTATTPRHARRVAACERLTPEHAVQRQRAQDEAIVVAWKVERRANGQELISISSEESSNDDDDDSEYDTGSAATNSADESHCDGNADNGAHDDDGNDGASDEEEEVTFDLHHRTTTAAAAAAGTTGGRGAAKHHSRTVTSAAPSRKRARNSIIVLSDDGSNDSDAGCSSGVGIGGYDLGTAATLLGLATDSMSPQRQQHQKEGAPVIYSIDSDSDAGSDGAYEVVGAHAQQQHASPLVVAPAASTATTITVTPKLSRSSSSLYAFASCSREAVEGDTTPEASGSSCGDVESRIKSEVLTATAASVYVVPVPTASVSTGPVAAPSIVAVKAEPVEFVSSPSPSPSKEQQQQQQKQKHNRKAGIATAPIKRELSASTRVMPRKVIPLMRRKKLDEEDAAFLLFYGISETPTAHILGLIIEYIDRCVGERSAFRSHCIKFLLWRVLNARVDAALTTERLARSEWMKIVFSSADPSMRHVVDRAPLLPRPVRITVRPPQYICVLESGSGGAKVETKMARKQSGNRVEPTAKARSANTAAAVQNGRANSAAFVPISSKKALPSTPQRSHKRKLVEGPAPASPMSAMSPFASATYSPRKHRRRNGSVTMFEGELPTRRSSGASPKSVEIMKPLALNKFVTGANQSLPVAYNYDHTGYRTAPCIAVSPLASMTTAQLESHISSVRSEGRVRSSEKLADVLAKLMSDPRNYRGMFNSPVDPVALNLPTYTSIVKNPMDLGTVKTRLAEGKYMEVQDFARDVRLVFENAKLFNAPSHSVHQCADILLRRFDAELKTGLERKRSSSSASKHACSACYGHTCLLCQQDCLPFAQPHMQCSGACGADIRKGSIYYITRDGTRVWCHKCRTRLVRDKHAGELSLAQSFSQSTVSSSQRSVASPSSSAANISTATIGNNADVRDSMVRKKCDTGVESWVKCAECARWLHQSCGLFNPVAGEYATEHTYMCPLCRWRQKTSAPPSSSSLHNLLNPANAERDANEHRTAGLTIPPCELSEFIQSFLRRELDTLGHGETAASLNVRVLAFPGESMTIPESVVRAFDENATALALARPERDVAPQRLPAEVAYLSRGIYLFQQHDGVEVSLFTLFAQEFGDDCALAANRRAVYIAYIDSIRYLTPASARTAAYHLIMLAYFDYLRRCGFDRVHIWSCPPQKRISYVFWCRPAFQKTPSAEHLRSWYNRLLTKAKDCGIVRGWTTLYDQYLAHEDAPLPTAESDSHLIATRGVTARSVDPSELVWPVSELPPIFDGDFVPAELERILGRLSAVNSKVRRATEPVKNASIGSSGGKHTLGGEVARIKDEPGTAAASSSSSPPPPQQVEYKLREVFAKLQTSVKRMKQDLLVVHLAAVATENDNDSSSAGGVVACCPERTVPAWCRRVPRFFGSRFMFHQLCSYAGYQFDSLRRAKHSTMMILHHYFNEHLAQVNVFCRVCSLLITHAEYWACGECDRYALCDTCYQRDGHAHEHALRFGQQVHMSMNTGSDAATATYAISLASVQDAAQRIHGMAHRTPVLTCQTLDALASKSVPDADADAETQQQRVRLFFKCENLQKIGAFKYRGALNAVKKHLEAHPSVPASTMTFVTHSSGNHAQAVALAAKDAGARAVIVMPENAPIVKQNAVRGYGAEVVLCKPTNAAREAAAQRIVEQLGAHFIHPSNDVDVMSGQGTAALELLEQVQQDFGVELDAVVVPVGGGGLCSGVAMATKSLSKRAKMFAAEPTGAADAHRSFQSGKLSGHDAPPVTVADGLKTMLGDNNWPVIRDHVDAIVLVSDDEIVATMKLLWERMKLVVEPSGAVPVAAVLTHKLPINSSTNERGDGVQNIGIVLSGGNVDLNRLPWVA